MTPTEQNIAIAEWMGWTRIPTKASNPHKFWKDPKINCFYSEDDLPDCYGDLNAIAYVVSKHPDKRRLIFTLWQVVNRRKMTLDDDRDCLFNYICNCATASAPQWCQALLVLEGKWPQ